MDDPLILTAAFDEASADLFQGMRDRHFPANRNIVPAHLTLFHHLPGGNLPEVVADLRVACAGIPAVAFATAGPRFLGRGCALVIEAAPLLRIRGALARRWGSSLTNQDRQSFRPHVTVQNKVDPDRARRLCEDLATAPTISGQIVGLDLWFYRGGPWEHAAHHGFDPGQAT